MPIRWTHCQITAQKGLASVATGRSMRLREERSRARAERPRPWVQSVATKVEAPVVEDIDSLSVVHKENLSVSDIEHIQKAIHSLHGKQPTTHMDIGWISPVRTGRTPRRQKLEVAAQSPPPAETNSDSPLEDLIAYAAFSPQESPRSSSHQDHIIHNMAHIPSQQQQLNSQSQSLSQSTVLPAASSSSMQSKGATACPLVPAPRQEQRPSTAHLNSLDSFELMYDDSIAQLSRSLNLSLSHSQPDHSSHRSVFEGPPMDAADSAGERKSRVQFNPIISHSESPLCAPSSDSALRVREANLNERRTLSVRSEGLAKPTTHPQPSLSPAVLDRLRYAEEQLEMQLAQERQSSLQKLQHMLRVGMGSYLSEAQLQSQSQWRQCNRELMCDHLAFAAVAETARVLHAPVPTAPQGLPEGVTVSVSDSALKSIITSVHSAKQRALEDLELQLQKLMRICADRAHKESDEQRAALEEQQSARRVLHVFQSKLFDISTRSAQASTTAETNAHQAHGIDAAIRRQECIHRQLLAEYEMLKATAAQHSNSL